VLPAPRAARSPEVLVVWVGCRALAGAIA
jgi:hypothetical protein